MSTLAVTPLAGSNGHEDYLLPPECTLVEYRNVRILWNLGIMPNVVQVDAVLLSDASLAAISAWPRFVRDYPHVAVYATFPVLKMAQLTLYDYHASICLQGQDPGFTLDDVDTAFTKGISLKYAQSQQLGDLSWTPTRAGGTIGASIWTLRSLTDNARVVLVRTAQLARERVLDASQLLKEKEPDVLIVRPGRPGSFKKPAAQFTETVQAVLRRDGHVLVPTDAAGRLLELIYLLEPLNIPLVVFGPMVPQVLEWTSSLLEWQSTAVQARFDASQANPWRHLRLTVVTQPSQLADILAQRPTCVLATGSSLSPGPAAQVLPLVADNPDHALVQISATECQKDTPGGVLYQNRDTDVVTVTLPQVVRTELTGPERIDFEAREQAARTQAAQELRQEELLNQVEAAKDELRIAQSSTKRFDSTLFLKYSKPLHLQFAEDDQVSGIVAPTEMADDYGVAVQEHHFHDVVSGIVLEQKRVGDDIKNLDAVVSDDEDNDEQEDEETLEAIDLSEGRGIIRGREGRPPMKVTTEPQDLDVLAEVMYFPLEGRADAQAIRQSVRALQPQQLVVLGGPTGEQVSKLVESSQPHVSDGTILAPADGERVELQVGHAAYDVRILDVPYQKEAATEEVQDPPELVERHEQHLRTCSVSLVDAVATGQKVASDGAIVLAPRAKKRSHDTIMISEGEVLLTDLLGDLRAMGMKAEYSTHNGQAQLLVSGRILVQKRSEGNLLVEGPLCEDYWKVRSAVRQQYVVL